MSIKMNTAKATIFPCLRYRDAPAAIEWLCATFGFEKHAVYPNDDGTIAHAQQGIKVVFNADLGETAPPEWVDNIEQLIFHGSHFMDEVDFFHKSTSTLILANFIENFEPKKVSTKYRWLLRLAEAADPDGKAPFDLMMTFRGRKKQAFNALNGYLKGNRKKSFLLTGAGMKATESAS